MSDTCPKCGRKKDHANGRQPGHWERQNKCFETDGPTCLRRQLAVVTAERDEARKRAEIAEDALMRVRICLANCSPPLRGIVETATEQAQAAWEEVHKGGDQNGS
jgi:hypothetical protein